MKLLLKLLRNGLGQLIILIDFISRPKKTQRPAEEQNNIDTITRSMSLYEFHACPFCVRTRRALRRLNLNIERRDAMNNAQHRQDLLTQGGKIKVPCLRLEENGQTTWMYESLDIIHYLEQRFGSDKALNTSN